MGQKIHEFRILPYHDSAMRKYEPKGLAFHCKGLAVSDRIARDRADSYFMNQSLETTIGGI